ncbi:hypothetical protein ACF1GW_01155 [Streptomyces achromogenes]|uniref:hypothetical protein n=1 Tax=Streptomyces achromogenes TaxID=67255 RepID=UPI0036F87D96
MTAPDWWTSLKQIDRGGIDTAVLSVSSPGTYFGDPAFPRRLPALLGLAGPARLLYGGDCCWTPADATRSHAASFDTAPSPVPGTEHRRRPAPVPRLAH